MVFNSLNKYKDLGLLIIRIGIGIAFMIHGYPKIAGGVEMWGKIGGAMETFGISFAPVFWGFMAAFSEFFGGLLLILGLFFRPAALLMCITMLVAVSKHISGGDDFGGYSHAFEAAIVFAGLFIIGPGKYSIDYGLIKKES